ncbi:MAG: DNA polymerase III [Lachnospiraceae bacterium]|nr:DNA polymerase III [Lachnospiraceae bacterium]
MKIDKSELARKINRIKSTVPKKTPLEAIQGVLVEDGYLIANNMETAVKVKLEASAGETFIIPARAFDLINNLPNGEVEIKADEASITIRIGSIKNKFASTGADQYPRPSVTKSEGTQSFELDSESFVASLRRVAFAIADTAHNTMNALCLRAKDGKLNYIALDGHIIAWDKVEYDGDFELLIPKNAVEKLVSIGLTGKLTIEHSEFGALFITDECEVSTRLVNGEFFNVEKAVTEGTMKTVAERAGLVDAINRARACMTAGTNTPVRMELAEKAVSISIAVSTVNYSESVPLIRDMENPLTIAFDSRLLTECLKAFDSEEVELSFSGPKMPLIIRDGESDFLTLILPVALAAAGK